MILKIKAKIYQLFGIFLAYREQSDYVHSKEFWKQFNKIACHKDNDMNAENIYGLLIGSWQAQHGFCRPFNFKKYKK